MRTDLVEPSGNKGTERMLVKRDGRDYPVASPAGPATIALTVKSLNPYVGEGIVKLDGKGIVMLSDVLSADGKTHTVTSNAEIGPARLGHPSDGHTSVGKAIVVALSLVAALADRRD